MRGGIRTRACNTPVAPDTSLPHDPPPADRAASDRAPAARSDAARARVQPVPLTCADATSIIRHAYASVDGDIHEAWNMLDSQYGCIPADHRSSVGTGEQRA